MLTGKEIIDHGIITDLIDATQQEQSCGVDLTVKKIETFQSEGSIDFDNSSRIRPRMADAPKMNNIWILRPGPYLITFNETVSVPVDMVGMARSRSSLLRMGASMETALWDPGYTGKSQSMLVVHNPNGLKVYQDAKLMQIIFMPVHKSVEKLYSGIYQGENLE